MCVSVCVCVCVCECVCVSKFGNDWGQGSHTRIKPRPVGCHLLTRIVKGVVASRRRGPKEGMTLPNATKRARATHGSI